jgi:hypothetical protein
MKVKLSYTVEEDELLAEVALVLGNQGPQIQKFIDLFNDAVEVLKAHPEKELNLISFRKIIEEARLILAKSDLRLEEATEMVNGYYEYLEQLRAPSPQPPPTLPDEGDESPDE